MANDEHAYIPENDNMHKYYINFQHPSDEIGSHYDRKTGWTTMVYCMQWPPLPTWINFNQSKKK